MPRAGVRGLGEERKKVGRAWNYGLGLKRRLMKSRRIHLAVVKKLLTSSGLMDDG